MPTCPIQVCTDPVRAQQRLMTASVVALDTETTSITYQDALLVGISLYVPGDAEGFYLPVYSIVDGKHTLVPLNTALGIVTSLLSDSTRTILLHNATYDLLILRKYGVICQAKLFDTMYAEHRLDNTYRRVWWHGNQLNYRLKTLSRRFLGQAQTTFEEATGGLPSHMVPFQQMAPYAVGDTYFTALHYQRQCTRLKHPVNIRIASVLHDLDFPVLPTIVEMLHGGVDIDVPLAQQQLQKFQSYFQRTNGLITKLLGRQLDLSKPKVLRSTLQDMGLEVTGYTSLSERNLKQMAQMSQNRRVRQLLRVVIIRRNIANTISKFLVPLLRRTDQATGKLFIGSFQSLNETGRYSASKPNIQALPDADDSPVRQIITAGPGRVIVAADFKNIEPRCLAQALLLFLIDHGHHLEDVHLQGVTRARRLYEELLKTRHFTRAYQEPKRLPYPETSLLAEFFLNPTSGSDPYLFIAAKAFNKPTPTKAERSAIKTLYLGVVYGRGIASIARELKVSHADAAQLLNKFASVMPELGVTTYRRNRSGEWVKSEPQFQTYKDEVGMTLRLSGEATSLFGRKRRFPGLYHLRRCERCTITTQGISATELEWDIAPIQLWNYSLHAYVYRIRNTKTNAIIATDTFRRQVEFLHRPGLCKWPFHQISYRFIRRVQVGKELVHFMPIEDCERQGFNAVIQATAGDVFKQAILNVRPLMTKYDARMIFNVHDELVFTVNASQLHPFVADLRIAMTLPPAPWWEIPIDVDIEVGPNYGSLTTYQAPQLTVAPPPQP